MASSQNTYFTVPSNVEKDEGTILCQIDDLWHFGSVIGPVAKSSPNEVSDSPRSPFHVSAVFSPRSEKTSCCATPCGSHSSVSAFPSSPACSDGTLTEISPCFLQTQCSCLERVFCTFDEDGDGRISVQDLSAIFDRLGIPKSKESIQALLVRFLGRPVNDDFIDENEFYVLYEAASSDNIDPADLPDESSSDDPDTSVDDHDLRAAFALFDLDGNGLISPEELRIMLCSLGLVQNPELDDCVGMIARADRNGDGHVDFLEFKELMSLAL
ncbi:hypothetical protein KP509_20G030500 [Ceratopteris richardii]|uniref:EF-hand domain-containing protein n=1 Tax=Ceratopteris richardii TaxID=49495 RepID=A0A8T2SE49_CERRI|nr:hypothetical protein KP509_20G030500 [Ceratopteris richardii]